MIEKNNIEKNNDKDISGNELIDANKNEVNHHIENNNVANNSADPIKDTKHTDESIDIRVKESILKWWKPKLEISDLYVVDSFYRWSLGKIISQNISGDKEVSSKIVISYFDSNVKKYRVKTVNFKFYHSKEESIEHIIDPSNISINNELFSSLDFVNIEKKDVVSHHSKIEIKFVKIHDWKLFDKIVVIEVIVDVAGYEKKIYKTFNIEIDTHHLIRQIIEVDEKNTLLILNEDLEFEVSELSSSISNYRKFFHEQDLKKLFQIIDEIKIFNPRIMADKIDFSEDSAALFSASIFIENQVYQGFVFKAKYNAIELRGILKKRIKELPILEEIQGFPRKNLELFDVLEEWKEIYYRFWVNKRGISNIFSSKLYVKTLEIDVNKNIIIFSINFKDTDEIIIKGTTKFEKTIEDHLDHEIENHLIKLRDQEKLEKYPLYDFIKDDFDIVDKKRFVLTSTEYVGRKDPRSDVAEYEFGFIYNDEIFFKKTYDIQFSKSKIKYLFENKLSNEKIDVSFFENVNASYFQEKIDESDYIAKWVPLLEREFDNVKFSKELELSDFEITQIRFSKVSLASNESIPLRIFIKSDYLKKEKILNFFIKINNNKEQKIFNNLTGDDIYLINKNLITSYPIPILDVVDFGIKKPFRIAALSAKYLNNRSLVTCLFEVTFLDKTKTITKNLYFSSRSNLISSDKVYNNNQKIFNELNNKDIIVEFDPNQSNWHIKIDLELVHYVEEFYLNLSSWKVINRRGHVELNIEVVYGKNIKNIRKRIKFNNKLTKIQYQDWKDVNYEPIGQ